MEHFEGNGSNFDDAGSDSATFDTYEGSDPGTFDIGITDGQVIDIDGDGVADGVASVSYSDLDGDGVADTAEVTITADSDGDGADDTVIVLNEYDTDGDGLADHADMSYGVDTDDDGEIDQSQYAAGTITNTPTDTDGDGIDDTMAQTVDWDDNSAAGESFDEGAEAFEVVQTSDGDYFVVPELGAHTVDSSGPADQVVESAYVDPSTGRWIGGASSSD